MFTKTKKNRKQAAYVAPEQTPQTPVVPEPETETVTVTVEIYPGAAAGEVSAADVATKLGVADLAAAIADGSVTYVGLNADGTVYTAEDGSTPSSTTKSSTSLPYTFKMAHSMAYSSAAPSRASANALPPDNNSCKPYQTIP